MLTMTAARRTAAVLTTALVAVLLVTLGGPSHAAGSRSTVSASHVGAVVKHARVPQVVAPSHQHDVLHLDLTAALPSTITDVRESVTIASPEPLGVRLERDAVAPTGRAPPTL